ncbi:MAG TPA: hypothetical protein PK649_04225 [Vicingus sp.]|nr:hypothetical protein [Vicingus sp.]HRP60789.1 hypothetical protein [Vicingus sp.]
MYNFCTLFDSFYLTRGITMYQSLEKTGINFHLYIFAFDDASFKILKQLNFKHATIVSLKEFENDKLLAVKPTRSKAEYCWTCTSSTILHVLTHFNVDNCTYVDADLFFYSSPAVLITEMGEKSVLITEHRYTPKYDRSAIAGTYCVQFITFKKNEEGLTALNWWVNSCLEWCFDRYEDGKFGDQKYLDDWTTRFRGVHVLQHLGGGLAPWNIQQYKILKNKDSQIELIENSTNKKFKAVFYHYHYVRFYSNQLVDLGWFKLQRNVVNTFYANYIKELNNALVLVQSIESSFKEGLRPFSLKNAGTIKDKLKIVFKMVTKYNLYSLSRFLK